MKSMRGQSCSIGHMLIFVNILGIYIVCSTLPDGKKNSLHRSNAVHGQRPARFRREQASENHTAHADHIDADGDTTTIAETQEPDPPDEPIDQPSHGLKGLLYHIAEANAKMRAYEHRGIHCEECGQYPIHGVRWHCLNCPDFDLCSTCEATTAHPKTHVFVKIKIPLPVLSQPSSEHPPWYPGDPRKLHAPLHGDVKKRLGEQYDFDAEQMDALYDQFTCLANVPWNGDPNNVFAAIDRRAFNKALTSERWPERFRPNALYDRMFAFYDTNNDKLIGFEEFLSGIDYLRGKKRFTPLRRALQGFDIDGDEFVDRQDFVRLMRPKYEVQKLLLEMATEAREKDETERHMDTLRSSLPISSMFTEAEIPVGEERPAFGKHLDTFGDLIPYVDGYTILKNNEGWFEESELVPRQASTLPASMDGVEPGAADFETTLGAGGESNEAFNENVLRQIVEEGIHDMLDRLFADKESKDEQVVKSREERKKWRKEIDAAVQEKARSQMHPSTAKELADGLLPTDFASLKQRELEIVQAPLDDLLDATGYSVNNADEETAMLDPTMPQNRPNSDAAIHIQPPPRSYLLDLATHDPLDREIQIRGGPGKLSFNEIEELVQKDQSGELKDIVRGWLEWASF